MSAMPGHVTPLSFRIWIAIGTAVFGGFLWLAVMGLFWLLLGMPT
jgi:hypothetical protein